MITVVLLSIVVSALTSIGMIYIGRALWTPTEIRIDVLNVAAKDPDRWMRDVLKKSQPIKTREK